LQVRVPQKWDSRPSPSTATMSPKW